MASPQGQRELSALFHSLGIDLTLHGPLVVLPSNLVQQVLSARYPDLAAHQMSVPAGRPTEKNLHVSLLKLHHGLPIEGQCSEPLFRRLAQAFVREKLSRPDTFGFNNYREVFHREMMAILARHRDHALLIDVRARIPDAWDASWIDAIHTYVHPAAEPAALQVFSAYARDYAPATGEFRVRTPGTNAPG